jgi:hypothetical protein
MNFADDYQWRYRRPAPSVHELFAAGRLSHDKTRRRRTFVALASMLLVSLISGVVEEAKAHPCSLRLGVFRLRHGADIVSGSALPLLSFPSAVLWPGASGAAGHQNPAGG